MQCGPKSCTAGCIVRTVAHPYGSEEAAEPAAARRASKALARGRPFFVELGKGSLGGCPAPLNPLVELAAKGSQEEGTVAGTLPAGDLLAGSRQSPISKEEQ